MQKYAMIINEAYADLAGVAVDSLKKFSTRECIVVNIGDTKEPMCYMVEHRTRWVIDNLKHFPDGLCLIDADIVATPNIDKIWDYYEPNMFPLLPTHPHQHTQGSFAKWIKYPKDTVQQYMTPSLWYQGNEWFAHAMLNVMDLGFIDEQAANMITWASWITKRMPVVVTSTYDAKDYNTALLYHGIKDARVARKLFNDVVSLCER